MTHTRIGARLAGPLLVLAFACACWLAAGAPLRAEDLKFPALSGRIVDEANLIAPDARARIEQKLAAHEAKTSDQIVVATVPSLQGDTIEDFANRLFRFWKLGEAKTNNGVLLLVAPNERKVRIEVGYGLEGTLTDALSSVIISGAIAPKFKGGDFAGGIEGGIDALTATLTGDDEWQRRAAERPAQGADDFDPMAIVMLIIIVIVIVQIMAAARGAGGGRSHRTRGGNWIVLPPSRGGWGGGGGFSGGGGFGGGGGFSGGGGSSGGGGASGSW